MVFPVSWLLISSVDMLQVMYGGCPLEHNSLIIDLTYFQIILAQYCVEGLDSVNMVSCGFLTLFYNYSSLRNRRFAIFHRISYIGGNHNFTPSVDFRLLRNV